MEFNPVTNSKNQNLDFSPDGFLVCVMFKFNSASTHECLCQSMKL